MFLWIVQNEYQILLVIYPGCIYSANGIIDLNKFLSWKKQNATQRKATNRNELDSYYDKCNISSPQMIDGKWNIDFAII